jgi:hypothetical protein
MFLKFLLFRFHRVTQLFDHMTKNCGVSYYHNSKSNEQVLKPRNLTYEQQARSTATYKTWTIKPKQKIKEMLINNKIRVKCPHCDRLCSYLNKHIRDVHMPKVNCDLCGKTMGQSYLNEHKRIQHGGKVVPLRKCPLCSVECQKIRNHFRYQHGTKEDEIEDLYKQTEPQFIAEKKRFKKQSKNNMSKTTFTNEQVVKIVKVFDPLEDDDDDDEEDETTTTASWDTIDTDESQMLTIDADVLATD